MQISRKTITRFLKVVSAVTSVRYKSVHYIEGLLWEFEQNTTGFYKICPIKRGVHYIECLL